MITDPSEGRVSGPLAPWMTGYAQSLVRQGYTPNSATLQMQLTAHLSRWLAAKGVDPGKLRVTDVEGFLRARRRAGYTQYLSEKALRPLLTYLRDQGVVPPPPPAVATSPVDVLIERYRAHLTTERGLRSGTARGYSDAVYPFVRSRLSSDGFSLEWASLRAADVTGFVVAHTPSQARGTAKMTVTALRSLLGFLHVEGLIARPLATVVPSVARWRLTGLPKGLAPAEVQALLGSCDLRTRMGRRDVAVLLTLLRLGLRAGELAALRLDDIEWRAGTLVVRGKGPQIERLPLPADVGDAMVAYLRRGRPATAMDRSVFVRIRAPHRGLSAVGVTQIVAAAGRRAGLGRIHAHRLRHTAATQLLRAGAPLPEIGQLLRHRRLLTTAIYAKVDRAALRTIARPWPGSAA